ncbi:MAG: PAS domain S-box protein [Armatimonadetes bacterium]|nr:PAS domain S-box protein [Armatimonadota bacterium]
MRRLLLTSLRTRLVLLVLLPVVPILGLSLYSFTQQRAQASAFARADALRLARQAAAEQDQLFAGTLELLAALARHPPVRARESAGCVALVTNLLSPFFVNLAVATPQGEVFCSAVPTRGRASVANEAEFKRAMGARGFALGQYRRDPITGRPVIHAVYPIINGGGRVLGVAVAALDLAWLNQLAAKVELPPGTALTVLDAGGVILAGAPDPAARIGHRIPEGALLDAILTGRPEGMAEATDVEGVSRLIGLAVVGSAAKAGPVYVAVGIPTALALAEARRILTGELLVLALFAALAAFGAWGTGNALILRPARTLAAAAERLRTGDLTARSGLAGAGELGELGRAFDGMAAALDRHLAERTRAEEALARSSREFGLILRAAGDGIFGLDLQGHATFVNPAAAAMLGWTTEELIGQPIHGMIHHTRTDGTTFEREDCPIYAAFTDGAVHHGDAEVFWRKDGTSFPVEYTSTPMREASKIAGAVVVFQDITERRRAEMARLAQEAAEQANRAKSEFLSRMSHELRTPLNAVLGFAQLLEMDSLSAEQHESVQHILKAGRHLLDLITEVLDIARIEAGRLAVSPEPLDAREVVEESLALIAPLAAGEGIRVEELPAGRDWHIVADRQRLKQVLLNLLSNAVKYNRRDGAVEVGFEETAEGRLRISVRDTGPGIAPERAAQLFTPFERLGADQKEIEGTGLGLALSKRLVEAMGGTLGLKAPEGEGSIFWVEFPLAERPDAPSPSVPAALPTRPSDRTADGRTILYIDDNLSNVGVIRGLLAHRPGITLLPAMQGRLGLDLAREHQPHLILLDLHLADISGEEVLRRLQEHPDTRRIPVVVISADPTGSQAERVRAAGAQGYLAKPLDMQQLLKILDEVLAAAATESVSPERRVHGAPR